MGKLREIHGAPGTITDEATQALASNLKSSGYKVVYESYVNLNWELFVSNADGSAATNLTRTPQVHEHYPQISPDGSKLCFLVDQGEGREAVRSLWMMDIDGANRRQLVERAREPFWSPDGRRTGFLHPEFTRFNVLDYSTKGMAFYDLTTGHIAEHPNSANLLHLYNPGFSRDGKWIVATAHAGMGVDHGILLIEASGTRVINLALPGCRPAFSPDGRQLAWGASDHDIAVAPISLGTIPPSVGPCTLTIHDPSNKILHVDWSPDGRFVSFSRGPATRGDPTKPGTHLGACGIVGVYAPGWNIFAASAISTGRINLDGPNPAGVLAITTNGLSNKESTWFAPRPSRP
jgi:Tol biopolymer transport system component